MHLSRYRCPCTPVANQMHKAKLVQAVHVLVADKHRVKQCSKYTD